MRMSSVGFRALGFKTLGFRVCVSLGAAPALLFALKPLGIFSDEPERANEDSAAGELPLHSSSSSSNNSSNLSASGTSAQRTQQQENEASSGAWCRNNCCALLRRALRLLDAKCASFNLYFPSFSLLFISSFCSSRAVWLLASVARVLVTVSGVSAGI